MKLLQLHWGFLVGGGSRYVRALEQMAASYGIQSHGVCLLDPRWRIDEATLREVPHTRVALRGRLDPAWIAPVAQLIRAQQPDLIMTHGFNAHFVAWLLQRRRASPPVVCSYHGPYHPVNLRTRALGLAYERFTEHFFRHRALAVVTVAGHARDRLVRRGVPAAKITVIPNGLSEQVPPRAGAASRLHWRRQWGVGDQELLVGSVGRLDPVKGQRDLVQAFAIVASGNPRAKLVLVGDGPDRAALEALIRASPAAGRIVLAGSIAGAEEILPALDVYALPSWSECHSIALLEAMRAGCPIVATAVGGNLESLVHEREGLLVPAADPATLGLSLLRLLGNDAMRRAFGTAARLRFLKDFAQEGMLRQTAQWLRACMQKVA